jgi:putative transposase
MNIAVQRTGALFERPFKRIPIGSESYLIRLIVYIHQNPQKHKFVRDFRDWNYSSFHELASDTPTRLNRARMMELFGSHADFVRIHQEIQPLEDFEDED